MKGENYETSLAEVEEQPTIDWGPLPDYFTITDVQFGKARWEDTVGRSSVFDALTFTVETRRNFMLAVFLAEFYDAEGFEVGLPSLVEFKPDYLGDWQRGQRSHASIVLPSNLSRIESIQIIELMEKY